MAALGSRAGTKQLVPRTSRLGEGGTGTGDVAASRDTPGRNAYLGWAESRRRHTVAMCRYSRLRSQAALRPLETLLDQLRDMESLGVSLLLWGSEDLMSTHLLAWLAAWTTPARALVRASPAQPRSAYQGRASRALRAALSTGDRGVTNPLKVAIVILVFGTIS
jgi:hypothetical protein